MNAHGLLKKKNFLDKILEWKREITIYTYIFEFDQGAGKVKVNWNNEEDKTENKRIKERII